jgi:hypothetical protein
MSQLLFFWFYKCMVAWYSFLTNKKSKSEELHGYLSKLEFIIKHFDGIVIGWSSSKTVSGSLALPPRWPPQCSYIVIESSFDPGERLQAPGSLWFNQWALSYPMTIPSKFQTRWFLCEFPTGSYVKLSSAVQPSWSEGRTTRHNFGRRPSNDYFIKVWFQLSNWFSSETYWTNLNQSLLTWSLGGPLPKLCPASQTSDQDGHHSRT